jgi:hypothetical protein
MLICRVTGAAAWIAGSSPAMTTFANHDFRTITAAACPAAAKDPQQKTSAIKQIAPTTDSA